MFECFLLSVKCDQINCLSLHLLMKFSHLVFGVMQIGFVIFDVAGY
jgi:hypothetical protein